MAHLALDGPLDLEATLRGGQSFRWASRGGVHVGVARGHRWRLELAEGGLRWRAWPREGAEATLRAYLGVDRGHRAALARLARDPLLRDAAARYPGLRLLRQDPWEATAAFVLSQNNNVRRLEGLLPRIARAAGEPREAPAGSWWTFPSPRSVLELGEARLRELGCGYRAPYLLAMARAVDAGDVPLGALETALLDEARTVLTRVEGVGPKVADCILLYALGRGEVFPVDRWIARWLRAQGMEVDPGDPADVRVLAAKRWGGDAGLAQQLLFHATRLAGKGEAPTHGSPTA